MAKTEHLASTFSNGIGLSILHPFAKGGQFRGQVGVLLHQLLNPTGMPRLKLDDLSLLSLKLSVQNNLLYISSTVSTQTTDVYLLRSTPELKGPHPHQSLKKKRCFRL